MLPLAPDALARSGVVSVNVSFLKGEQPVVASRRGSGVEAAVEKLLAGPTAAETKKGIRSQLPAGVRVKSLTVEDGVASIDLGAKFASGTSAESLPARFAQLVLTLTGVPGVDAVKVRVDGDVRQELYPGVDLRKPVTAAMLAKPKGKPPVAKAKKGPAPKASMLELEKRLVALGFLDKAQADGRENEATFNAAMAFQKWAGIGRDGKIGPITRKALDAASAPDAAHARCEGQARRGAARPPAAAPDLGQHGRSRVAHLERQAGL